MNATREEKISEFFRRSGNFREKLTYSKFSMKGKVMELAFGMKTVASGKMVLCKRILATFRLSSVI